MAHIIVPQRRAWARQPQGPVEIDWSHPLARGLIFETGGHALDGQGVRNLAHTERATFAAGVGQTVSRGRAISFSGVQTYSACSFGDSDRYDGLSSATWQLIWWSNSATSAKPFAKWGANNSWLIQTGTGLTWVACEDAGGLRRRWDSSSLFSTTGTLNHAVLSWRGAGEKTLIVNGVDKTSSLTPNGTTATVQRNSSDVVQLGIARDGSPLNGGIVLARMWKRGLTLDESREIGRMPFQIIRRRPSKTFISLASGAPALEGHAQAQAGATGNLVLAAVLDGAALVVAGAGGNLTTQIPLAAASVAVVSATGDLLTGIPLSGAALAQAIAAGALTAQIRLDGAALAQATAQAGLTSAILLAGNAQGQAGAGGTLAADPGGLTGDAQAAASAVATLTTRILFSGTAAAQAGVAGILTTQIPLTAAVLATAIASGMLTVPILLAGQAFGEATASGILSEATEPPPVAYCRISPRVSRLQRLTCRAEKPVRVSAALRHPLRLDARVSHV